MIQVLHLFPKLNSSLIDLLEGLSPAQWNSSTVCKKWSVKDIALFPVSWAGEDQSQVWFDIAREYTERWHHQQQIRQAVGAGSILERELYYPFLEISMLALPFHYRLKAVAEGTVVRVTVVGDAGGSWSIIRKDGLWEFTDPETEANTQVYIDQNIAWMLLSKGIDIYEAEQYWQIIGDYELGFHALKMTAFMI